MFKIGDFSKLTRVSVKTLRYYDEIGLLKPLEIDRFSGYRYYSARQLPRLNRILALKDLGFSLEQISKILDEELPIAQLRGMLRLKQAEVEQTREVENQRLAAIERRLKQIEQEGKMSDYEVVIKKVESIRVAGVHETIPDRSVIGPSLNRMFDTVCNYISSNGAKITEPGIALWHDKEYREQGMEVGAAMPFSGTLQGNSEVKVHDLERVETMACVVHHGSFDEFPQAYKVIMDWIEANSYRINGPGREVYIEYERNGDPANYVTEIQFPVVKG